MYPCPLEVISLETHEPKASPPAEEPLLPMCVVVTALQQFSTASVEISSEVRVAGLDTESVTTCPPPRAQYR